MSDAVGFQFLYPHWLLLIPVVWWYLWRFYNPGNQPSGWDLICDAWLLQRMLRGSSSKQHSVLLKQLTIAVLSLGIVAAAGPSWRPQSMPMMESASARVLVLDLSRDMLVRDVKPDRLTRMKTMTQTILDAGFAGETGLVVFAANAFVVSPLSSDANTLRAFLEALEPDVMPKDGHRLDLAIRAAGDLLRASIPEHGQILVLTAGVTEDEAALAVTIDVAEEGNHVSIIAVGSAAGGPMQDSEGSLVRDQQGVTRISRINRPLMQRIARSGGGKLINIEDNFDNSVIYNPNSDFLKAVDSELDASKRQPANDGFWLILLMLPLALLMFKRNLLWSLALFVVLPVSQESMAAETVSLWLHAEKAAFEAYQRENYSSVFALSDDPLLTGAAFYRSGQFQRAIDAFSALNSATALYNRGNAQAQLMRIPEAIADYKAALSLDPALTAARVNMRLLESHLEQQDPGAGDSSESGESSSDINNDNLERTDAEMRIGIATEESTNPGDDPQLGPGLGASAQSGQVDPFERFDGQEREIARSVFLADDGSEIDENEFIDAWIKTLPETSADLFRRKFLRDYHRQKQQDR